MSHRTPVKLSVTGFTHALQLHAHQLAAEVEAIKALAEQRQVEPSDREVLSYRKIDF